MTTWDLQGPYNGINHAYHLSGEDEHAHCDSLELTINYCSQERDGYWLPSFRKKVIEEQACYAYIEILLNRKNYDTANGPTAGFEDAHQRLGEKV